MSTSVAKRNPTDLDLGPIRLTATGVEFTAAPTFEEYQAAFQWVKRCEGAVAWWCGDLVVNGDAMFGEAAAQEYDRETIRKFAWVAEKISPAIRRKALSFTHHEKVARLPAREQDRWLKLAEAEGWSAKELARQIKADETVPEDDEKEPCPTCGRAGWDGIYKS